MLRRKVIQLMTLAGTGVLASYRSTATVATTTVTYTVKGFSCITCATGLDTMLSREPGIKSSRSTYPEGIVKVWFNPERITAERIAAFIGDLGFTVIADLKR